MHQLEVGKLYIPGRTSWPEAVEYNWLDSGHELRIFLARPTKQEIQAIRKGQAEFGLFLAGNPQITQILFLLAQFGEMPWMDAPYSYHLVPPDRRPDLHIELGPETRFLLQVLLIDAATGILHVIRAVSLSPEFSRELLDSVRGHAEIPFDPQAYDREVDRIYVSYSSSRMAQDAWVRCVGGE